MCRSAWVNCSGYPARHEHNRAKSRHRLLFRHRQGSPSLTEFAQLDYLYAPSSDVAGDARFFTEGAGGKPAFAVEGMGGRVAMGELTDGRRHVVPTDLLEGGGGIYIYRAGDRRK